MNAKNTLGQFLLSKYMGALLAIPEIHPSPPDSVGTMIRDLDNLFAEAVRFRFKQDKPSIEQLFDALVEYYASIGWEVSSDAPPQPQQQWITGTLHIPEAETSLGLVITYDAHDGDVLIVAINPILA